MTLRILGLVWPVARQGAELIYQFDTPYIVDDGKYRRTFGAAPTPYREGIRQTVAWHRQVLASESAPPARNWWRNMWRYGSSTLAHSERKRP